MTQCVYLSNIRTSIYSCIFVCIPEEKCISRLIVKDMLLQHDNCIHFYNKSCLSKFSDRLIPNWMASVRWACPLKL